MVPDTTNFSLQDVQTELGLPSTTSLVACFTAALYYLFDSDYEGSFDRLSNFRNYGDYGIHITGMGANDRGVGEDIAYIHDYTDISNNNFKPGFTGYKFQIYAISKNATHIRNITMSLWHRTNDTSEATWGALNCDVFETPGDVPVLIEVTGGDDWRVIWTVSKGINPGQYRWNYLTDGGWSSIYRTSRGSSHKRNVTIKRYVDISTYSNIVEKGSGTGSFTIYLTEGIEVISNTGGLNITSGTPTYASKSTLNYSYTTNGDVERILNCTVRTINSTLREFKTFYVYQRGEPSDYMEVTEVNPNYTYDDETNSHAFKVKNNSTLMSYTANIAWQIKEGDTEGGATLTVFGNENVTNLASLNTIDIDTGDWVADSGLGANAYFYARIGSASYELIATHTKLN